MKASRKNSIVSVHSKTANLTSRIGGPEIDIFIERFNEANYSVELEKDHTGFNLIKYEKQNERLKHDPMMMNAKLRKLENHAELKRVEMEQKQRIFIRNQQISQMNKKSDGKHRVTKSEQKRGTKLAHESYKTIYNKFIKGKNFADDHDDESDAQNHQIQKKYESIAFINELKSHPRILDFTLQRIQHKSSNKQIQDRQEILQKQIKEHQKSEKNLSRDYQDLLEEQIENIEKVDDSAMNPESVVENKFSKFFSKKSSENLNKEIRNMERCGKMIEKQNRIVSDIDEKSLSKDGKKKLKSRLNEIIMAISKSEKASQIARNRNRQENSKTISHESKASGFVLPKINSGREEQSYLK